MKKGRLDANGFRALFTGAVLVQVVYQVMMVLLNEGEMIAQVVTVVVFGLFAVFFWMNSGKADNWPVQLALVVHGGSCFCGRCSTGMTLLRHRLFRLYSWDVFFVIVFMRKLDWRSRL